MKRKATDWEKIPAKDIPNRGLGASQTALVVKNTPVNAGDKRHRFDPWVGKIPWRRAWQPTPIFLPRESQEQRSLAGDRPCGCRVRHDWSDLLCKQTLKGRVGKVRWVAVVSFFVKLVTWDIKMNGWDIHWGRRVLGNISWFLSQPHLSEGRKDFWKSWSNVSWLCCMMGTSYPQG